MLAFPAISALILTSTLVAQGADASKRHAGIARGPHGEALAGARVSFYPAESSDYPWLSSLLPVAQPITAVSDSRGRFDLSGSSARGSVWIEHPDGFGGLYHNLHPGIAQIYPTEPLGELHLASLQSLRWEIRALLPGGESIYLGHREGETLRLPAGFYLLLIQDQDHVYELPARIRSGERLPIALPEPTRQELLAWNPLQGEVYLSGWPRRLASVAGRMFLPQPASRSKLRWHRPLGSATWIEERWYRAEQSIELSPLAARLRRCQTIDADGLPLAGVRVCVIIQDPARVRVQSMAITDQHGFADLAIPADERATYIVAISPGYSPSLLTQERSSSLDVFRLEAGKHARIRILDPRGQPLPGTRVELWQEPRQLLHRVIYSNLRGEVQFADLADAAAHLRVDHQAYLAADLTVIPGMDASATFLSLRLEPGLALRGEVVDPANQTIAGAIVELRGVDPGGHALKKTQATDALGKFHFTGLPDARFTVFVTVLVAGITWSGRRSDLPPGEMDAGIVVRPEDPPLPHKK